MARRKVAREDTDERDELVLDYLHRDFNPMDLLAANIEAGSERDDLGRKE